MATSPRPYDSVRQYLRDIALALGLFIAGVVVAGAIAEPFRDVTKLAYPAALCIGLVPLWWFLRRCQIHNFDGYDSAGLAACFLIASVVRSILPGAVPAWIGGVVVYAVFGVCVVGWGRIRRQVRRSGSGDGPQHDRALAGDDGQL